MDNLLASTDVGTSSSTRSSGSGSSPRRSPRRSAAPARRRAVDRDVHPQAGPPRARSTICSAVLATGAARRARAPRRAGKPSSSASCPTAQGAVDGVVITLIDVSGLKAAEDALFHERYLLNSLLCSVPDAIYFKDARGRFIRANHAMAARLGLADPRDAVGQDGARAARTRAPRWRCTSRTRRCSRPGGAALQAREARARRTARDELGSRDAAAAARRATSGIVGVIAIFRDVTEQKRAEEKIQEAVRRRDEFLAMLSHELRNPLGAIVDRDGAAQGRRASPEKRAALARDPRAAVPADGAPARRSPGGEPRHPEQDRARKRGHRSRTAVARDAARRRARASWSRGAFSFAVELDRSRSGSTAIRRGSSRSRSTC